MGGEVNGFAIGLMAPAAGRLRGISAGLGAVVAEQEMTGIQVGGLAAVSGGSMGELSGLGRSVS